MYDFKNVTNFTSCSNLLENPPAIHSKRVNHKKFVIFKNLKGDGLSLEDIEKIEVPFYFLQKQVTLYTKFHAEHLTELSKYSNIIINKTSTLAVKYPAIDYQKKIQIAKQLKRYKSNCFYVRNGHKDFYQLSSSDKEKVHNFYNNININNFIGKKEIFSYEYLNKQRYACLIHVAAVPKINIKNLIETFISK